MVAGGFFGGLLVLVLFSVFGHIPAFGSQLLLVFVVGFGPGSMLGADLRRIV